MKNPLTIIASVAVFFSFFLPWISSGLGTLSAFEGIKYMLNAMEHINQMPDDFRFYLPFLLLALPICSLVIIINELSPISKKENVKNSIVVIAIVVGLVIIGLIYLASKSETVDVFNLTGSGFWVSLISTIFLLVTLNMEENSNVIMQTAKAKQSSFCQSCGTKAEDSSSQYCENCGSKL